MPETRVVFAAAKNHRYEARIYPDSGLVLALELG